jgi:3D (Asp-Asp-Asp) domain-containing protein
MMSLRKIAIAGSLGMLVLVGLLWLWRGSVFPLTSVPLKTDPDAAYRASAALFPGSPDGPLDGPIHAAVATTPAKQPDAVASDFTIPGTGRDFIDRGKTTDDNTAGTQSTDHLPTIIDTRVRTTAYTHTESDHIKYGTLTALGTHLRYSPEYHSVAADWSRFPLGTKFRMKGHNRLFVVDDYGKALVGGATIDIYFPTKERMNHWGVRWVDIEVVEFGNFHESRKILAARANYPHCREMLATMTSDDWWKNYK